MKTVFFFLFFTVSVYAESLIEYDYELDIYYSNVSAFIDLDRDKNITDATNFTEVQIYNRLMRHTFSPNIFLIEAAFHPMSWAGVWYRDHYPSAYEKANINDFNFVKTMTAGWEEPYALSFFVGRMLVFRNKYSRHIGKNRAYIGYLLTIGDQSIKDNFSYDDKWALFEFKLKGTRELEDKDLDWSFRIGYKYHDNKDFVNTFYIGARRSSIDFEKSMWSIRYNSEIESLIELSSSDFSLTKAEIIIGKKWPLKHYDKITLGLGLGYLYYGGNRYRGALKEEGIDKHQLIFRPNLKW